MTRIASYLFVLAAVSFSSVSLANEAAAPVADGKTVTMGFDTKTGSFFAPKELTVPVGTTVTFANTDGSNHSVVFKDGTASGRMKHNTDWKHTFPTAGSFPYECSIHGASMSGTIIVK